MADIDNIQEVKIGAAATFRNTINDNFDIIKDEWTGIYVGNSSTEAANNLKQGGLWIETE